MCDMLSNTNKVSFVKLEATENAISVLIEGTAGLAGSLEILEKVCDDGLCLLDRQVMSECREMLSTMNRLLCERSGRLEHLSLMQEVHAAASNEYVKLRRVAERAEKRAADAMKANA